MTLHTYCPQWLENGNDLSFLQKGHQGQSYQLLSNLTHLYLYSKQMEHIITKCMMSHLDEHNILHHLQHGIRQDRSCETQLPELPFFLSLWQSDWPNNFGLF